MRDPYAVLGLERDATPEQIRVAFRRLSKKHHPDRGGKAEDFTAVVEAYDLLRDPERRAAYDRGEREADKPDPVEVRARSMISDMVEYIITDALNRDNKAMRKKHLVKALLSEVQALELMLAEARARVQKLTDKLAALGDIKARISRKKGRIDPDDVLVCSVEKMINITSQQLESERDDLNMRQAVVSEVRRMITAGDWEYRMDPVETDPPYHPPYKDLDLTPYMTNPKP